MNKALTYDDVQLVPQYSEVLSRKTIDLSTQYTKKYRLQIPIVASPMDTICEYEMAKEMMYLGGVGIVHRFMSVKEQSDIIFHLASEKNAILHDGPSEFYEQYPISAAIGVTGDYLERAQELVNNGCKVLLLDVAHGDHILVKDAINYLRKKVSGDYEIIAGNIATRNGAKHLCEWRADGIRVGIGGGSLCSSRLQTGVGIPNVTSIQNCVKVAEKFDIPVIADGGIRYVADICKAIGSGADTIILGSLLSGTKETPGKLLKEGMWPNERLYKRYAGSASVESKLKREVNVKNVEGYSTRVEYKGKVKRIIHDIEDGLRSSLSYVGSKNISEFQSKCEFIEISNSSIIEALPHGLK